MSAKCENLEDNFLMVSPINSNGVINISTNAENQWIYSNEPFSLIIDICSSLNFPEVLLEIRIIGTEYFQLEESEKPQKHQFFNEIIESKKIALSSKTHSTLIFPYTFTKKLPSSFEYYEKYTSEFHAKIYYKVKVKILQDNGFVTMKNSYLLNFCSNYLFAKMVDNNSYRMEFWDKKVQLILKLSKEIYKADEQIFGNCKLSKNVLDISTDFSNILVRIKLIQNISVQPHYFGVGAKNIKKELINFHYTTKGRSEFLDTF